ncbi:hypothetical protein A6E05_05980 [Aliivibrio sp. 1S165]|uniref:hypothetical protein n=1 Tax=unclassified Aliivibrio TaxID=2645654 RepID=UPI00080E38C3|nr:MULTISPECIES: hypothetical protein [unclassified Aliivibrio]OCH12689.1 hypothetical protein A6E05_05980 [Aliivibrio sp. 1S165]OCH36373.1 hypothetical protein A6E06_00205 [Aliivibrio sp. 1S175]
MNPIDKITDPTFTNSAKGLMTLFCIGLGHTIIGVELTEAKIAIPWFPTINFLNPQNLVYLYWGLVWYSMYRYVLENALQFREYWFYALASSLRVGQIGESFVRKSIYINDDFYDVKTILGINESEVKGNSIDINIYEYDEDIRDLSCSFKFQFTTDFKFKSIECTENPSYQIETTVLYSEILRSNWGLNAKTNNYSEPCYRTTKINTATYRHELRWLKINHYVRDLLTNRKLFDLTLPLLFNLILFAVWVINLSIEKL